MVGRSRIFSIIITAPSLLTGSSHQVAVEGFVRVRTEEQPLDPCCMRQPTGVVEWAYLPLGEIVRSASSKSRMTSVGVEVKDKGAGRVVIVLKKAVGKREADSFDEASDDP